MVYPVTHEMELWQAEQFGPVIPIAPYESIDEPIAWLEKMHFGQQSAIFTSQEATQPDADLAELLGRVRAVHLPCEPQRAVPARPRRLSLCGPAQLGHGHDLCGGGPAGRECGDNGGREEAGSDQKSLPGLHRLRKYLGAR